MFTYFGPLAQGIANTIVLTLGAFAIGVALGLPLALARRSRFSAVRFVGVAVIDLVRGIPSLVMLFIVFYGIGSGAVQIDPMSAAIGTLGVIAGAYMAEIYRGGMLAVHFGQWEAAAALGLSTTSTYIRVILPQAVRVVIPPAATLAIGLLKDSAVASTIGVPEITAQAVNESHRSLNGIAVYATAAVIYLLLSAPVAAFSRWAHQVLSRRVAR